LMIDIPANIKSMLLLEPTGEEEEDEEAFEGLLNAVILEMRKKQFSEELVAMSFDFFKENNKVEDMMDYQSNNNPKISTWMRCQKS
jgi:hypothetical protein